MFNKHLFKTIAGFCGMILFGLVSLVVMDHYQEKAEKKSAQPVVYIGTEDISEGSVSAVKSKTNTANAEVKLLPYHEALGLYTGKRVEINNGCQSVPSAMVFKNNTKVMVDNKSDASKTLKIGKTTTTVKARGFKIMNLSNSKLPAKLALDCDTSKGVATITLEK